MSSTEERIAEIRERLREDRASGQPLIWIPAATLVDDLEWALSLVDELQKDAARWKFVRENGGEWSLGFVAGRGKWYCEGPDDANLDERYATADEAVDAAIRIKTIRDASETQTATGKVIDLMAALKASLAIDAARNASPEKAQLENSHADSVSSPMTGRDNG